MIRKSGYRFSEKDHAQTKKLERKGDLKKSHPASVKSYRGSEGGHCAPVLAILRRFG
jgi:hypothetical protein